MQISREPRRPRGVIVTGKETTGTKERMKYKKIRTKEKGRSSGEKEITVGQRN
jgi:hypothetical protein